MDEPKPTTREEDHAAEVIREARAAVTAEDIQNIIKPLEVRHSVWRLWDLLVALFITIALVIGGLGLITARNSSQATNDLATVLANRSPTIEHLACFERRNALVTRRANERTRAFDQLVLDALVSPRGTDPLTDPTLVADRQAVSDLLDSVEEAQASLDAANDPTAPKPQDLTEALKPLAMTQCPAFPQFDVKGND